MMMFVLGVGVIRASRRRLKDLVLEYGLFDRRRVAYIRHFDSFFHRLKLNTHTKHLFRLVAISVSLLSCLSLRLLYIIRYLSLYFYLFVFPSSFSSKIIKKSIIKRLIFPLLSLFFPLYFSLCANLIQ